MDEPTTCCTGWHVQNEVHFMLWGPNSLVMVCRIRSAENFVFPSSSTNLFFPMGQGTTQNKGSLGCSVRVGGLTSSSGPSQFVSEVTQLH